MVGRNRSISCGVFELSEFIGDGSTGQVWKGTHSVQGIDVAVKILSSDTRRSWDERRFVKQSFEKEIEAITSLNHPGIVRIFDIGKTAHKTERQSEGVIPADEPYIVMEYAPEGALRHHSRLTRWQDLKPLLIQLLDALAYAHSREVLHRDVKPENVLVFLEENDGQTAPKLDDQLAYRLTDFGLAHPLAREDMATKDVVGAGAGTPTYMAPEQLKKEWRAFGPWTDLYSLGCMVYEIVCGRPPYQSSNAAEMMIKHLEEEQPTFDPEFPVPDELAGWVRRLMAKQPRDRFECAADAAYALNAFCTQSSETETDASADFGAETNLGSAASWSVDDYFSGEESADGDAEGGAEVSRSQSSLTPQGLRRETRVQTGRFGRAVSGEDPEEFEPPPPVPSTWFVELPALPPPPVAGAGISLVGQREVPLVDRADERDTLWQRFQDCERTGQPAVTVLTGKFGVGKTRLATWTGRRISELGVGRTIICEHGPDTREANSLPRLVERFFGTWNLEESDIAAQILQRLETMTGDDDQRLQYESIQLASLALLNERRPREDRQTARPLSRQERFEVVTRLLQRLARQRMPVVIFDDIHRSEEALEFLEHIGNLEDPPGCLFVATIDEEVADPDRVDEWVDRLRAVHDYRQIEVDPLVEEHLDRFLRYLLKFEDESHERLVKLSDGHPGLALDIVEYLVEFDKLELSDDGYAIPAEFDEGLPEAIRASYPTRDGPSDSE